MTVFLFLWVCLLGCFFVLVPLFVLLCPCFCFDLIHHVSLFVSSVWIMSFILPYLCVPRFWVISLFFILWPWFLFCVSLFHPQVYLDSVFLPICLCSVCLFLYALVSLFLSPVLSSVSMFLSLCLSCIYVVFVGSQPHLPVLRFLILNSCIPVPLCHNILIILGLILLVLIFVTWSETYLFNGVCHGWDVCIPIFVVGSLIV